MRAERLERAREQMEAYDLGALVLYAGANVRYVTASYQGNWKYNINIRYAVLPKHQSQDRGRQQRDKTVSHSIGHRFFLV